MDRYQRRQRRKLLDDLMDLQCLPVAYNVKSSDDDDEYPDYHRQRKEYCLIKVIYRNSNTQRQRRFDEIMVIQNHQTVFKGCQREGDEFTFKSRHYEYDSKFKLKFYINDLLDDEIVACCAHGLIDRNRPKHLFHIEEVIGAKPCYDCEFNKNLSKRSDPIVSDKSTVSIPKTDTRQVSNDEFAANVNESKKNHVPQLRKSESDEDSTDSFPITTRTPPPSSSTKRTYGPPQLSNLLSMTDSIDIPSPTTTNTHLMNSAAIRNQNESIQTPQYLSPQVSTQETTQNTSETSSNVANANEISLANAATEMLLARLGITRQEQVERPEDSSVIPQREKGNVESFTIVYLHETNPDQSIVEHLRNLVNFLKIFNDIDDCIAFINTVIHEKLIFIVSYTFHQSILPRIQDLTQIGTIYILLENNENKSSIIEGSKIRGSFTDIDDMYKQIAHDIEQISPDLMNYLSLSSSATIMQRYTVFFLLTNEIILDKTEEKSAVKRFITFVRQEYEGNEHELKFIEEFENTYKKDQALHWYSRSCFISKMLNKALRLSNPEILYYFQFFIQDLSEQIQYESSSDIRTVYLGQTIDQNDFEDLQANIQTMDLILFSEFLSGLIDRERAIEIARQLPLLTNERLPLLFSIEIPDEFKCVCRYSSDENNVLFNFNIIGRLLKIDKEDSIVTIHMRLIRLEEQTNIQNILETVRKEVKTFTPFVNLTKLLIYADQHTAVEQMVRRAFNDETDISDVNMQGSIAAAAHLVANARREQQNYAIALEFYLLSLQTFHRIMSPNSVELSVVNSNIGSMYFRLTKYDQALEYYSKALNIQLHSNTPDLFSISAFTNSIGIIYSRQGKYAEAIKSFERTIKILQQHSEPHDAEFSTTYEDLGDVYLSQQKYEDAIENYRKGLEYLERIIPRNFQNLGTSYHTIGNLYLKLGRSKEALTHLKQALEYFQQILPATHSSFALLYNNIGLMYYREEQHDEALKHYAKALEVAAVALPENHSLVAIALFNTALAYTALEKYDQAIEYIEKSTEQFRKTLPEDHPDVVENRKYIESIRQKKALKEIFDENTTTF